MGVSGSGKSTVAAALAAHLGVPFQEGDALHSPENVAKIYDPFYTTKAPGRGTGLGLSICYGIVQEHRGRLEVSSQPGRGSVFRIVLPTLAEPA